MIDRMIGHYRILEEIGRGGMGVVYKALDTKLNRPVAIKSLQAENLQDEGAQKRFLREALMVARLDHPYICKVYEILEQEGGTYIVLEYVRGRPLSELMVDPAQPVPLDKVLEYGREIAEALEEAHKNGVVHRDIKPGNIMLLDSGHIKVLDFGLAKPLSKRTDTGTTGSASLTSTGTVLGTLTHMSPEQIRGQEVDARSDIFSFGIVMYEMVAGQRPFVGDTGAQVAAAIINEEAEPLHRYRKGVPEGLDRVIQRMLEKDCGERYQSVHEVWVELRHIREELAAQTSRAGRAAAQGRAAELAAEAPTVVDSAGALRAEAAVAAPAPVPKPRFFTRPRQWYLGFATALGVVAVAALVVWYQGNQPVLSFEARDWILISDFKNETGDSMFDQSLDTAFSISMSQSQHANVVPRSRVNTVLRRMGKKPDIAVDEGIGREVCQRENIRGLICPGVGKIGSRFVLTARIVDPHTGDSVRSYSEQAENYNEVLPALDTIAATIRRQLGESMQAIRGSNRPLESVTTSSLQALKQYSDALQVWGKGQHSAAVELLQSAIKEDPDFASAHVGLGIYYSSFIFNNPAKGKEHFEKALSLTGRTTEREAQRIKLEYESQFGTFETARDLYELYLRSYPDSAPQHYNYGSALRENREYEKAIEQYKEALRIDPGYASAYINLATTYSQMNIIQEALATYARAFELEPAWITSGNLNHEYGYAFVAAGDFGKAREVFTKALSTPSKAGALRSLALLDLYQGKYHDAKAKLEEAVLLMVTGKAALSEARNRFFMYILLQGQGDAVGSMRELDKAAKCLESLSPQVWMNSRIGIAYARNRSIEKASRMLEVARKGLIANDAGQNSEMHRLEGEIELARGNRERAVELLLIADRESHGPFQMESLARAQMLAGKADDALASYEVLVGMRNESDGWEPQQDWLAAHVQLAKLYVSRKEEEKARRILGQFLALWKEADPDLSLNKEALRMSRTIAGNTG